MIKFKHEVDRQLFPYLSPNLIMALGDMAAWAKQKGLPFVITETITSEKRDIARGIARKSKSHVEGRAVDVSVKKWSKVEAENFHDYFDIRYQSIAARSYSTGLANMVVYGLPGHTDHFHIQVSATLAPDWDKHDVERIQKLLIK